MDSPRRAFLQGHWAARDLLRRTAPNHPSAWRVDVSRACLNHRRVECRLCGDTCEPRALRFAPSPGGVAALQVHADACTGCGECVSVCPVGALSMRDASN